jgi:hypothetical protein
MSAHAALKYPCLEVHGVTRASTAGAGPRTLEKVEFWDPLADADTVLEAPSVIESCSKPPRAGGSVLIATVIN